MNIGDRVLVNAETGDQDIDQHNSKQGQIVDLGYDNTNKLTLLWVLIKEPPQATICLHHNEVQPL